MTIDIRTKRIIIAGVIVGVVVIGALLGHDQYSRLRASISAADAKRIELAAQKEDLKNLAELNETMKSISGEMENVEMAIPKGLSVPELLTSLETVAIQSGMVFNSIAVSSSANVASPAASAEKGEVAVPESISKMEFVVSASGGFKNLKKYLDSIEKNIRVIDVESVEMDASGMYLINMQTYYVE
ncbi:MAG: hypothetical protein ACD_63C00027G0001 [uncultured bacterium]|nr:MAG: hypothetical protein ACD_63C00027G0001 [uncultured bacterium]